MNEYVDPGQRLWALDDAARKARSDRYQRASSEALDRGRDLPRRGPDDSDDGPVSQAPRE